MVKRVEVRLRYCVGCNATYECDWNELRSDLDRAWLTDRCAKLRADLLKRNQIVKESDAGCLCQTMVEAPVVMVLEVAVEISAPTDDGLLFVKW